MDLRAQVDRIDIIWNIFSIMAIEQELWKASHSWMLWPKSNTRHFLSELLGRPSHMTSLNHKGKYNPSLACARRGERGYLVININHYHKLKPYLY